jgi:phosphate transport system permease protein
MIKLSLTGRRTADSYALRLYWLLTALPVLLVAAIVLELGFHAWPILTSRSVADLLFGETWLPNQGLFGFFPFISGTLWVTTVSILLSAPPCLLTAIFLAEYASSRLQEVAKPVLDLLVAIPSVVYGMWGVIAIVPWVQSIGPEAGKRLGFIPFFASKNPTGFSVLAGGIVLGVMIAPFIVAISYEVLRTIPAGYREASLAVGATKWETVKFAVLPQAVPGMVASIVLGALRALGETMAVLMVVGNVAKTATSIFDPAYPLPALIANNYGEMLSIPLYDSALMTAALILLVIVLLFNLVSTLWLRGIIRRLGV